MTPGLRTNFAYNVIGSLVPIVVALVTVPLYIHQVGVERYGIIAIAWLLLGYFGFLDFGLSRASANALSRLAHAPAAERSPVIMTAFYLNLGMGLVGGLVMFAGGQWLLASVFKVTPELRSEALAAFPWVAAMLPVGMLSGIVTGVLELRYRFLTANLLGTGGSVVGQLLPLGVAVFISPTLPWVIPAMLLARLATLIASGVFALRLEFARLTAGFPPGLGAAAVRVWSVGRRLELDQPATGRARSDADWRRAGAGGNGALCGANEPGDAQPASGGVACAHVVSASFASQAGGGAATRNECLRRPGLRVRGGVRVCNSCLA